MCCLLSAGVCKREINEGKKNQLLEWRYRGSNSRPFACKANALPTELYPQQMEEGFQSKEVIKMALKVDFFGLNCENQTGDKFY